MSETVEQLKPLIATLTPAERADLAHFILDSLEPAEDADEVAAAWETEVARRVAEIKSGTAVGVPAEQLFAELRKQYP